MNAGSTSGYSGRKMRDSMMLENMNATATKQGITSSARLANGGAAVPRRSAIASSGPNRNSAKYA